MGGGQWLHTGVSNTLWQGSIPCTPALAGDSESLRIMARQAISPSGQDWFRPLGSTREGTQRHQGSTPCCSTQVSAYT